MRWKSVFAVAVVGAIVFWRMNHDPTPIVSAADIEPTGLSESDGAAEPAASGRAFTCEGKTRCSQMSSCEEATFYIRNCPNAQMDGDRDGVPCEDHLCERE